MKSMIRTLSLALVVLAPLSALANGPGRANESCSPCQMASGGAGLGSSFGNFFYVRYFQDGSNQTLSFDNANACYQSHSSDYACVGGEPAGGTDH